MNGLKGLMPKVLLYIGIALFVLSTLNPFKIVGPGERGIVIRLGAIQDKILSEGLHFRIPMVEEIKNIDVKNHKLEVESDAYSKDLQNINTKIALNFHVDPYTVNKLMQEIGTDFQMRVINPAIDESVKAATAKFTAAELVSQRALVKEEIKSILVDRLARNYIKVDDFSIVNFSFSDSYERAIEEKQVAEQIALKAQNDLRRIQVEAEQRIAQAKAEAEAIRIQTEALRDNQNLVKLEAVKKWDGILPKFMTGGSSVPFIDVSKID